MFSNDPKNSKLVLTMDGKVKTILEVRPSPSILFRGIPDLLSESTVDVVGTAGIPFHIVKSETNLEGQISFQVETVEDGSHYRVKVANLAKIGNYNGFIKLHTDILEKPEVPIHVSALLEGDVSAKPQTILVGRLTPQQPVRVGRVVVTNNRSKPFQITKLEYDQKLIKVDQQPVPNEQAYTLEITPILENIAPGKREQTTLSIHTDAAGGDNIPVQVHIMNSPAPVETSGTPANTQASPLSAPPAAQPPAGAPSSGGTSVTGK